MVRMSRMVVGGGVFDEDGQWRALTVAILFEVITETERLTFLLWSMEACL